MSVLLFICDALRDLLPFVYNVICYNVKIVHGGVLLSVKLQVFKWYQITQSITFKCFPVLCSIEINGDNGIKQDKVDSR